MRLFPVSCPVFPGARSRRSRWHRVGPGCAAAGWLLLALQVTVQAAPGPEAVQVPSLGAPGGTAVVLPGRWFVAAPDVAASVAAPAGARAAAPAAARAAAPAFLLMHGCGGPYDGTGRLAARYTELAARLNALGVHVLVTDSFTPRGEGAICTQAAGLRRITQLQRRRDALGALQWMAAQPGVDAQRLGLLGWSNGGSSVLAALNRRHPEVAAAPVQPSLAVAFYPGCESEAARGFEPTAPLLMLLAELDDWTPAAPCKALAQGVTRGPAVQWESYAGAYHGFDGTAPLRLWKAVPNGVNPGQGVHMGAEPAARDAAALRLGQFIKTHWNLYP